MLSIADDYFPTTTDKESKVRKVCGADLQKFCETYMKKGKEFFDEALYSTVVVIVGLLYFLGSMAAKYALSYYLDMEPDPQTMRRIESTIPRPPPPVYGQSMPVFRPPPPPPPVVFKPPPPAPQELPRFVPPPVSGVAYPPVVNPPMAYQPVANPTVATPLVGSPPVATTPPAATPVRAAPPAVTPPTATTLVPNTGETNSAEATPPEELPSTGHKPKNVCKPNTIQFTFNCMPFANVWSLLLID